jgi:hyperpolarization activated cyclic nucleotide-gated potassium channel 2
MWLWLDLLSSVPYTWFTEGIQTVASDQSPEDKKGTSDLLLFIRLFRFLRIFRLLRLMKLKTLLIKIEDYIASDSIADAFQFTRLFLIICMAAHWIACWFVYITREEELTNPESWLQTMPYPVSNSEVYVTALYFTFTTMTTVGYGDILPNSTSSRMYVTFTMILSCGIFAYTLGSIGSLVAKQNAEATVYREKVVNLNQYMRKNNLPGELQFRVRRFLEYIWGKKIADSLNEREILKSLSEPLRDEVYAQVNGAIVNICPVFVSLDQTFVTQVSKLLVPETFAPGDVVFEQGLLGGKMFYIVHGKIDVFHQATNSSFKILHNRGYFGEISFFTNEPRCASTRCLEFADVLSLERSDTEKLMLKFPLTKEHLQLIAKQVNAQKDLSVLNVRCYICKSLGHVAIRCRRILLNLDHEEIRSKWLHGRNQHSRYINVEVPPVPNHMRAEKRVNFKFSSKNVLGFKRKTKEMFPDDPNLLPVIRDFEDRYKRNELARKSSLESVVASPRSPKRRNNKPRYSIIYKDSESSGDDESVRCERMPPRRKTFRKSLIQVRTMSAEPDGVTKTRSSTGPETLLVNSVPVNETRPEIIGRPRIMPFDGALAQRTHNGARVIGSAWSIDSLEGQDLSETPLRVGSLDFEFAP